MTENCESIVEDGSAVDRISSLPRSVIDCILECLPVREAARTSILSRNWRYIWAEHPSITLNEQFSQGLLQSTLEYQTRFANVVNKILLQHEGPILKFVIDISNVSSSSYSNIDMWMLFLSRKGVRELTLINAPSKPYEMPSYIFSFSDLTYLKLSNCILKAPNAFQSLYKLKKLILEYITFEKSVWISTPKLVFLKLSDCGGIRNFDISAPALENLHLFCIDYSEFRYYTVCLNMKDARLVLPIGDQYSRDGGRISLIGVLGCWLRLERLSLDGSYLKFLSVGNAPEKLPFTLNCLKRLVYISFDFDLNQIAWILCLLRSSPVLQEFELGFFGNENNDVDGEVQSYLEDASHMGQKIEQLRTVKMRCHNGSYGAELLFVKHLLVRAPSLETIFIREDTTLDLSERLRISKELMEFSRLSPKAKVVYKPDVSLAI